MKGIDDKGLRAKPPKGRSLRDILLHVLGADKSYVYALVGPLKPMGEPSNAAERGDLDLRIALVDASLVEVVERKRLAEREDVPEDAGAEQHRRGPGAEAPEQVHDDVAGQHVTEAGCSLAHREKA